jgi:CheY-like chemotaxis protein
VIRVVVVDDEALVRSGVELVLGAFEDIEVVATASGGDAVETVRRQRTPPPSRLSASKPSRRRANASAGARHRRHLAGSSGRVESDVWSTSRPGLAA